MVPKEYPSRRTVLSSTLGNITIQLIAQKEHFLIQLLRLQPPSSHQTDGTLRYKLIESS